MAIAWSESHRRKALLLIPAAALGAVALWSYFRRSRKTGFALLKERNLGMHTKESTLAGTKNFPGRPSDIFIVTYPKCGTTWVTQIAHQLRAPGHMEFGEITEVVPWDILALDCGQNLSDDQVAAPRLFKSHESHDTIAKGCRYIYVCRDPRDAFWSFYHFLPSYCALPPNSLSPEEFADGIFAGISHSGYIWDHMLGWWRQRHDPDVLILFFEDLKENLPREVDRVARWMGYDVQVDRARVEAAIANANFEFMQKHSSQFDEHFTFEKRRHAMGIPRGMSQGTVGKVRQGAIGAGNALSEDIARRLEQRWLNVMSEETGYSTYAAFRAGVNQERVFNLV